MAVVVILIVVAAGWWFFQNQKQSNDVSGVMETESVDKDDTTEEAAATGLFSGRLSDLIARRQSVECQFTATDPQSSSPVQGTLQTNGDKFSMSMVTIANGAPLTMRILKNGTTLYMWSDDAEAIPAMKIESDKLPNGAAEPPSSPASFLDNQDAMTKYDCRPWSPEADSFTVPADINFTDMAALMPKGLPSTLPPTQNLEGTSGLAPVPGTTGDINNYNY